MKIRSPDYYNLQALNIISTDHYLADLIASLGTADFVLGSIDRSLYFDLGLSLMEALNLITQLWLWVIVAIKRGIKEEKLIYSWIISNN